MLAAREQVKLEPATRKARGERLPRPRSRSATMAPPIRPLGEQGSTARTPPKSTGLALAARLTLGLGGMRVAAIDLGTVRVGVAISDELGLLAHPRPHLPGGSRPALLEALAELARTEGIERFLVGLP